MAFCNQPLIGIPDETRRVAEAVCRGSTAWYLRLSRELRKIYSTLDFAELYPDAGQWGIHPYRAFAILMLQVIEGLSDRAAADQICTSIGWKYILSLELDDEGWHHTVFVRARDRLLRTDPQKTFLDAQLRILSEQGLLKTKKQRIDATSIDACVKVLNRTELVLEAVRNAIEALSDADPDWLASITQSEWIERYYLSRPFNYGLPRRHKSKIELAQAAGEDGFFILYCIEQTREPKRTKLSKLKAIVTLRQILEDQFYPPEGKNGPTLRDEKELKPSGERLVSPHETDARMATKRGQTWTGYKLHTTETCTAGGPNFITDTRIEPATKNDSLTLPDVVMRLDERKMLPEKLLADSGYVNATFYSKARIELGLDILSRLVNGHSWQSQIKNGFDISRFKIDFAKREVRCPRRVKSKRWKISKAGDINVFFPEDKCCVCPAKERCTKATRRVLHLQPEPVFREQQFMRQRQDTTDFKLEYSARAGAEGTQAEFVRVAGRRSKVRGQNKTNLTYVLAAVAVNFGRFFRHQLGLHPRVTPVGKFLAVQAIA